MKSSAHTGLKLNGAGARTPPANQKASEVSGGVVGGEGGRAGEGPNLSVVAGLKLITRPISFLPQRPIFAARGGEGVRQRQGKAAPACSKELCWNQWQGILARQQGRR